MLFQVFGLVQPLDDLHVLVLEELRHRGAGVGGGDVLRDEPALLTHNEPRAGQVKGNGERESKTDELPDMY